MKSKPSKRQAEVLAYLVRNPEANAETVADAFGFGRSMAYAAIRALKDRKAVRRVWQAIK